MGFLLLLLLSLSALVQVELAGTAQAKAMLAARENARLGLMAALGELQMQAGPDQRVTATAPVGLSGSLASPQNANWVAVYDSDPNSADFGQMVGTSSNTEKWLISGDPAVAGPTSFDTAGKLSTGNDIKSSEKENYIVLVGANTAAIDTSAKSNADGAAYPDSFDTDYDGSVSDSMSRKANYVVAGKIESVSDDVPGAYAWWVGDEGVKADLNMTDATATIVDPKNENPASVQASPLVNISRQNGGQHSGLNGIFKQNYSLYGHNDFDETDPDRVSVYDRLVNINQLRFGDGLSNNQGGKVYDYIPQARYHQFTTGRKGVLTNTYDGGLRMNLDKVPSRSTTYNGDPTNSNSTNIFTNGSFGWDRGHAGTYTNNFFDSKNLFTSKNFSGISGVPLAKSYDHFVQQSELSDGHDYPKYEPYMNLGPIITELRVRFAVFQHAPSSNRDTALRFYIEAEIFNPYPFHLLLGPNYDTRSFTVKLENLPEIRVSNINKGTTTGWRRIEDVQFPANGLRLSSGTREVASWMEMDYHAESGGSTRPGWAYLRPGEVFQIADPDRRVQPEGLILYFDKPIGPAAATDRIKVELRVPPSQANPYFTAKLLRGNGNGRSSTTDKSPVFEMRNIPYFADGQTSDELTVTAGGQSNPRFLYGNGGGSDVDVFSNYMLAFGYRFLGTPEGDAESEEWLGSIDLRKPYIDFQGDYNSRDGTPKLYSSVIEPLNDPFGASVGLSEEFARTDLFSDNIDNTKSDKNDYRRQNIGTFRPVILYDMPIGFGGPGQQAPIMSIASLRSLPLGQTPPYVIGEPLGGEIPFYSQSGGSSDENNLNRAFDKYFFSSVPDDTFGFTDPVNPVLPNTRYLVQADSVTASELREPDSARYFLVDGMFNINSVNPEAWSSVLAQNTEWWNKALQISAADHNRQALPSAYSTTDQKYFGTSRLNNAFFRFPFNAYFWGSRVLKDSEINVSNLSEFQNDYQHQQPVRVLDGTTGNLQIQQLSWHIANLVKEEGPFMSLGDFINHTVMDDGEEKGLIQAAIDRVGRPGEYVGAVGNATAINKDQAPFSNTYVTQGDVIAAIAPIMSARSDTFIIRSYGETRNPVSGAVTAHAYLEARVQRVVRKVDDSDPNTNADSLSNARAFEIVSARWLNDSEI